MATEIIAGPEKSKSFHLVSRTSKSEKSLIKIGNIEIGGKQLVIMAGPCAIESEEQILKIARQVKDAGANVLRGGAFKPRSSPYSFQGLGKEGLRLLKQAAVETGLLSVTEVLDQHAVNITAEYSDILQIGSRNMQNFALLQEVSKTQKPVLLKRGLSATYEEFLSAAEYIMYHGNEKIILCERGIRTYEKFTRNTLDIAAIPIIKELSHLPIIVDPSHAMGMAKFVPIVSRAAIAAGADGLIIEVHPNPKEAMCDGEQSLNPETFAEMMGEIRQLEALMNRYIKQSAC